MITRRQIKIKTGLCPLQIYYSSLQLGWTYYLKKQRISLSMSFQRWTRRNLGWLNRSLTFVRDDKRLNAIEKRYSLSQYPTFLAQKTLIYTTLFYLVNTAHTLLLKGVSIIVNSKQVFSIHNKPNSYYSICYKKYHSEKNYDICSWIPCFRQGSGMDCSSWFW